VTCVQTSPDCPQASARAADGAPPGATLLAEAGPAQNATTAAASAAARAAGRDLFQLDPLVLTGPGTVAVYAPTQANGFT